MIFGLGIGLIIGFSSYKTNTINKFIENAKLCKVANFYVEIKNNIFDSTVSFEKKYWYTNKTFKTTAILSWVQDTINLYNQKYNTNYSLTSNSTRDNWKGWENSIVKNFDDNYNFDLHSIHSNDNTIDAQLRSLITINYFPVSVNSWFQNNILTLTNLSHCISLTSHNDQQLSWNKVFNKKNNLLISTVKKATKPQQDPLKYKFNFKTANKKIKKIRIPCEVSEKWALSHNLKDAPNNYLENKNELTNSSFYLYNDKTIKFDIVGYIDSPEFYSTPSNHIEKASIPFSLGTPIAVPDLALLFLKSHFLTNIKKEMWNEESKIFFNLYSSDTHKTVLLNSNELSRWGDFLKNVFYKQEKKTWNNVFLSQINLVKEKNNKKQWQSYSGDNSAMANNSNLRENLKKLNFFVYSFTLILLIISAALLAVIFKKQFDSLQRHFGVLKAHGYNNYQIAFSWICYSLVVAVMECVIALIINIIFLAVMMGKNVNKDALFNSTSFHTDWLLFFAVAGATFLYIFITNIIISLFATRTQTLSLINQNNKTNSIGSTGRKIVFLLCWAPFIVRFGISTIIAGKSRALILLLFVFFSSTIIMVGIYSRALISNEYNRTINNREYKYFYSFDKLVGDNKEIPFNFYSMTDDDNHQTNDSKNSSPESLFNDKIFLNSEKFWNNPANFNITRTAKENPDSPFSKVGKGEWDKTNIDHSKKYVVEDSKTSPALLLKFNLNSENKKQLKVTNNPNATYHYTEKALEQITNSRFFISRNSFTEVKNNKKQSVFDLQKNSHDCILEINKILMSNIKNMPTKDFLSKIDKLISEYYLFFKAKENKLILNNNFFLINKNYDSLLTTNNIKIITKKTKKKVFTKLSFINPDDKICQKAYGFLSKKNKSFLNPSPSYEKKIIPVIVSSKWEEVNQYKTGDKIPIMYNRVFFKKDNNFVNRWEKHDPNGWEFQIVQSFKSNSNAIYSNNKIKTNITNELNQTQPLQLSNSKTNKEMIKNPYPLFFYEVATSDATKKTALIRKKFPLLEIKNFPPSVFRFTYYSVISFSKFNYSHSSTISQIPFLTDQNKILQKTFLTSVINYIFVNKIFANLMKSISRIMLIINLIFVIVGAVSIISLNSFLVSENIRAIAILKIMGFSNLKLNILFMAIYLPIILFIFGIAALASVQITNTVTIFLEKKTNIGLAPLYSLSQFFIGLAIALGTYFVSIVIFSFLVKKLSKQEVLLK